MLTISDHRLRDTEYLPAADHGGKLAAHEPQFIVLHYTAGTSFSGAQATLTNDDDNFVSSHVLIGRDGRIAQLVDFDTVAWHAGKSSWAGLTSLNDHSIGIELVNPAYARDGITFDGPTVRAQHKNGGPERDWYLYTHEQMLACVDVCEALFRAYPTITSVIGHDDIAPDRKTDPGPAWDWSKFNEMLYDAPKDFWRNRVDAWFTWNLPSADIDPACSKLYAQATVLAHSIVDNTPVGPDQTIALRKLRECLMYCVANVSRPLMQR